MRPAEQWRPLEPAAAGCAERHPPGTGRLDERARRLSHEELGVAHQLEREGHQVESLPERPGRGRTADLRACGHPVEVKSWLPPDARGGRPATARSVFNKLSDAAGQAPTAVLWGRGSGLTEGEARAGLAEFAARGRWDQLRSVRVLGDGFDLSWVRTRRVERVAPERRAAEPVVAGLGR
ncbi:MAG: hypothetical protein ACYC1D_09260 [Acidimicrobiales bacterium]